MSRILHVCADMANSTWPMGYAKVRFGVEVYYSVVQPDDLAGAEWNLHLYMIPAAPSALLNWMQ